MSKCLGLYFPPIPLPTVCGWNFQHCQSVCTQSWFLLTGRNTGRVHLAVCTTGWMSLQRVTWASISWGGTSKTTQSMLSLIFTCSYQGDNWILNAQFGCDLVMKPGGSCSNLWVRCLTGRGREGAEGWMSAGILALCEWSLLYVLIPTLYKNLCLVPNCVTCTAPEAREARA